MPLAVENYIPFEKQLLACYWALLELEYLIRGYQVTVHSKLPIMGWALLDSPSHRVEQVQEQSTVRGKWNVWDWGQIGPEGMSKQHGQMSQTLCHPPLYASAPPSLTHMATYAGISYSQMKKQKNWVWGVTWPGMQMQAESGQQLHYSQSQCWPWNKVQIKISISRVGIGTSRHWLCMKEKVALREKKYSLRGRYQWPCQPFMCIMCQFWEGFIIDFPRIDTLCTWKEWPKWQRWRLCLNSTAYMPVIEADLATGTLEVPICQQQRPTWVPQMALFFEETNPSFYGK